MQFRKGADVLNSNAEKIGEIDRVVIDPRGGEVSHIVVRKGFFFREDKVLPIELLDRSEDDKVFLTGNIDYDHLPDFFEVDYLPIEDDEANLSGIATPMYWYPTVGAPPMMWGSGYWGMYPPGGIGYPMAANVEQNIPEGEIALEEGAEVVDQQGESIGKVDRVIISQDSNKMTHIVVTKGFLDQKKKLIPASWISHIKEDGVKLSIDSRIIERLHDYDD